MPAQLIAVVVLVGLLVGCVVVESSTTVVANGVAGAGLVTGSGTAATSERAAAGARRVRSNLPARVTIARGDAERVVVEADDNLVDLITTEVAGDRLVLDLKPGSSISTRTPIAIRITLRALDEIAQDGSGDIVADGIDSDSFAASLGGLGSIRVAGAARAATYAVGGSGTLDASALAASRVDARLTGLGTIEIDARGPCVVVDGGSGTVRGRVEGATLDARLTGLGTVTLAGRVDAATVRIGGSGSFAGDRLEARAVDVTLSGLGDAEVRASERLDATISGSGSVRYAGSPTVTSRVTGLGSVRRR